MFSTPLYDFALRVEITVCVPNPTFQGLLINKNYIKYLPYGQSAREDSKKCLKVYGKCVLK